MKRTILTLLVVLAQAAAAQQKQPSTTTVPATTATDVAAKGTYDAEDLRQQFSSVLRRNPTDVATILALDPTLLSNDAFLAGYPDLGQFVAAHPEVRRSPHYFLAQ